MIFFLETCPSPTSSFFSLGEIIPAKNNLLTELPFLGKEYVVMFEMFINKITKHESILHIGLGGDAEKYGDRSPAFFTYDLQGTQLCVTSSINDNLNKWANHQVELNKWVRVMVTQTLKEGKVSLTKDTSKTDK